MNKSQIINRRITPRILDAVNSGMNIEQAYDAVMGAGAYQELASELHDKLNEGKANG